MALGSAGVGERVALLAGGALALALVQLLQATLKNSSANTAENRLGQNGSCSSSAHNGGEEVTPCMLQIVSGLCVPVYIRCKVGHVMGYLQVIVGK